MIAQGAICGLGGFACILIGRGVSGWHRVGRERVLGRVQRRWTLSVATRPCAGRAESAPHGTAIHARPYQGWPRTRVSMIATSKMCGGAKFDSATPSAVRAPTFFRPHESKWEKMPRLHLTLVPGQGSPLETSLRSRRMLEVLALRGGALSASPLGKTRGDWPSIGVAAFARAIHRN